MLPKIYLNITVVASFPLGYAASARIPKYAKQSWLSTVLETWTTSYKAAVIKTKMIPHHNWYSEIKCILQIVLLVQASDLERGNEVIQGSKQCLYNK